MEFFKIVDRMFDTYCAPSPSRKVYFLVTERALAAEHKSPIFVQGTDIHDRDHTLQYMLIDRFCLVGSPMAKEWTTLAKGIAKTVKGNEKSDERAFVNKLIAACKGWIANKVQRAQENKLGQESQSTAPSGELRGSVAISDSSLRP